MNPILILRFAPHEGPGYLADYLANRHRPVHLVRVDQGDAIPASPDGFSGVALMGGPMSVNDPLPWIPPVLSLIRRTQERGLPMLGHCLGGQLISKALGGAITKNPAREIGWLPVSRVEGAEAHSWLDGLPAVFEVFHWHGETFSIPPGATRILESRDCANQAFVIGRTLAMQCHVEMTDALVHSWIAAGPEEFSCVSPTVQDAGTMTTGLGARVTALNAIAARLYDRWLA